MRTDRTPTFRQPLICSAARGARCRKTQAPSRAPWRREAIYIYIYTHVYIYISLSIYIYIHLYWAGHLARLHCDSAQHRVLQFRSLTWWLRLQEIGNHWDPRNLSGWRHHRPGKFPRWESQLYRLFPNWTVQASDRSLWRLSYHLHQARAPSSWCQELCSQDSPPRVFGAHPEYY